MSLGCSKIQFGARRLLPRKKVCSFLKRFGLVSHFRYNKRRRRGAPLSPPRICMSSVFGYKDMFSVLNIYLLVGCHYLVKDLH